MIELRWVMKPSVIADVFAQDVKVLQYREWSDSAWRSYKAMDGKACPPQWTDVPTVQEPAPK